MKLFCNNIEKVAFRYYYDFLYTAAVGDEFLLDGISNSLCLKAANLHL